MSKFERLVLRLLYSILRNQIESGFTEGSDDDDLLQATKDHLDEDHRQKYGS